jgi:hypothetical protein
MAWRPVALILAVAALCLIRGSSPPGAPEDGRTREGITVWRPAEGLGAVVAGFGDVWVDDRARERLLRVDGGSGRIRAAIPVDGRLALGTGTRAVWALQSGGGYGLGLRGPLLRIDPRTNRVRARIPLGAASGHAVLGFGVQAAVGPGQRPVHTPAGTASAGRQAGAVVLDGPGSRGGAATHLRPVLAPRPVPLSRRAGAGWPCRSVAAHRGTMEAACSPAGGLSISVVLPRPSSRPLSS